jgi:hypothetical protein
MPGMDGPVNLLYKFDLIGNRDRSDQAGRKKADNEIGRI